MAIDISVAHGDGIGPEIMQATLAILEAAGVEMNLHEVELGEAAIAGGHQDGIDPAAWGALARYPTLLKAPLGTPLGHGHRSVNVTLRQALGLNANVRPVRSLSPYVPTLHPDLDVVVIRENSEDLYTGVEYRSTADSSRAVKTISGSAARSICRYAFEYAAAHGRSKVTAFAKPNIMKLTDGQFIAAFEEVAADYPHLDSETWIVDIGMARVATAPERFDVIVTENLYGDILSDVTGELAGSVGLGGSANIGPQAAMFEAIHGTAPDIAGRGLANPSGLLNASIMMLEHLGQVEAAHVIRNAWLATLEAGIHTGDITSDATVQKVGTEQFADAVRARLGQAPEQLKAELPAAAPVFPRPGARSSAHRELVGVDILLDTSLSADKVAEMLAAEEPRALRPTRVSCDGSELWPHAHGQPGELLSVRLLASGPIDRRLIDLLTQTLRLLHFEWISMDLLFTYDEQPGFS